MKMFNRKNQTFNPTEGWQLVQRSIDGRYAIRRPDRCEEPGTAYRYMRLYGRFNGKGLHKIYLLKTIEHGNWADRGFPTGDDDAVWTNNIKALLKILSYTETVIK